MVEKIKELTVVDFYASWCGPCRMLGPIIEEVTENIDVKLLKIDVDESKEAVKYGIMTIPTIMVVKNGEILDKHVGLLSKDDLTEFILKHK